LQHHLRLGDHRHQLAILGFQPRLPYLGATVTVQRRRDSDQDSSLPGAADEIGLAFDRGGAPKPRVYFEEWDDPLISGTGWVSELIEIAGGEGVLPKLRFEQAAKDRIISPDIVRAAAPDVILASWCGKKVVPDRIIKRPGWSEIAAARNNRHRRDQIAPDPAARSRRADRRAGRDRRGAVARRYLASTPHHSAMNSAVAFVDLRSESISTYSLKPCMAAPLAPKHRLEML